MCESVDQIILRHSTRGIERLYQQLGRELCRPAAEAFFALERGRVFLYTGFYAGGKGETDGPLGAFFLYRGMRQLGFSPLIITDSCCDGYFPGCTSLQIDKGEDCVEFFEKLLAREQPVAHFSIERLGRDRDGRYLNCGGKDVAAQTPRLDLLFEMADSPSFAVGDGGNEIGMGNFAAFIARSLAVSPAVTCCDYPILASVSNWGGYGFLACLQQLSGLPLLPAFAEVERCLRHLVACGATDGLHLKNEMSVDGKSYLLDAEILAALSLAVRGKTGPAPAIPASHPSSAYS